MGLDRVGQGAIKWLYELVFKMRFSVEQGVRKRSLIVMD